MNKKTSKKKDRAGKKTVAISGMAQTSRDACPFEDPNVEVWVLNEAIAHNYIGRVTLLSQLHPEWDYFREWNFNDPLYPEFLKNEVWTKEHVDRVKTDGSKIYKTLPEGFPEVEEGNARRPEDLEIVLLEDNDKIAGKKTVYPFREIIEAYGANKNRVRYFTSTAPYLIALAISRGFERIEMYGFEMSSDEEYGYQKSCTEFWLGIAIGKGIEIYLPEGCRLLGETEELYGYDKMAGITRMHVEIRRNELARLRSGSESSLNKLQGKKGQILRLYQVAQNKGDAGQMKKLEAQLGGLQNQELHAIADLNVKHGAYQEIDRMYRDLQALPSSSEIRPVVPK